MNQDLSSRESTETQHGIAQKAQALTAPHAKLRLFLSSILSAMSYFNMLSDIPFAGRDSAGTREDTQSGVAFAVYLLWGISFSMIVVTSIAPSGYALSGRARRLAESHLGVSNESKFWMWLNAEGFSISAQSVALRSVSMLSPALVSLFGSSLFQPVESVLRHP